ncbi:hypothetical protein FA15DRAFT_659080 [Coprinopsis marcescibilis]|uniref:Uncharacterized protein n=1 Tax=Coprinopsis marcescibilis TaxID=230819 RepID=A0A5C3KX21_COPMA|nr:hypothetical protein FA15DRAFT_659080 [Coprinopsis marcescibilis]
MEAISVKHSDAALRIYHSSYANIDIYMAVSGVQTIICVQVIAAHLKFSPEARNGRTGYVGISLVICLSFFSFAMAFSLDIGSTLLSFQTIEETVWNAVVEHLGRQISGRYIALRVGEGSTVGWGRIASEQATSYFVRSLNSRRSVVSLFNHMGLQKGRDFADIYSVCSSDCREASEAPLTAILDISNRSRRSGLRVDTTRALAFFYRDVALPCTAAVNGVFHPQRMIALPIIRMRRRFIKLDVISPHQQSYTRVLAILIESSLPVTVMGTAVVIATLLGGLDPGSAYIVEFVKGFWIVTMSLAPQLIIYRVAMGESWTRNPTNDAVLVSQIVFAFDLNSGGVSGRAGEV